MKTVLAATNLSRRSERAVAQATHLAALARFERPEVDYTALKSR